MESCNGVEREVSAICDKFHLFAASSSSALAEALSNIEAVKEEMEHMLLADAAAAAAGPDGPSGGASLTTTQTLVLVKALQSAREAAARVAAEHRDLHSSVSKVGKVIDRNFVSDYDSTSRPDVFASPDQQRMLNEVILQHFYRAGQLEIGETLAAEAGIADEQGKKAGKEPFMEMNRILEALSNRDLEPALEWANAHRTELNDRGTTAISALIAMQQQNNNTSSADDDDDMSSINLPRSSALEFKLRRLKYIEMLSSGDRAGAIAYARLHFPPFVGSHEREVQSLMGAVMYVNGEDPRARLLVSPYGHLLDDSLWHDICDLFVKDACALLGLSVESPLSVAVNAGCKTLPGLLNIKQVMQQRQVAGVWNNAKDELPIEIDLGSDCRFHSIFACPILRQQTTDSNPPMRLTCGHCISRDALSKLSSGHKLKCPYCPVEQNPNDARQITF